jgi:16S rRNA (cytosine967-C5)-methyltransferase
MGSVPAYAAVSESVESARAVGGKKAAGLVNAVLRGLARDGTGPERFPSFDQDPVEHLTTWGSHPRWLVERWISLWGAVSAHAVVEAGNRVPEIFFRPIGIEIAEAARRLSSAGIGIADGPDGPHTLRLARGADPKQALAAAPGIIQDPAAAAVVAFVSPEPGQFVADLCAAPGGKGIGMMDLGARVVGADPSPARLWRMRDTIRRLGLSERLVVARGEHPPFRELDVVLVDAPCTGTGTLARHPDARWRLGPEAPMEMARVQAKILAGAANVVRLGGLLVYATCTLEEEENNQIVENFLATHLHYRLDRDPAILRVFPSADGTDGAFAVRLRRAS